MKKVLVITMCMDCPHCNDLDECVNTKSLVHVGDILKIPEWCPLESIQEYCESNYNIDEE